MGGKYERLMCDPRKWCVRARDRDRDRARARARDSARAKDPRKWCVRAKG